MADKKTKEIEATLTTEVDIREHTPSIVRDSPQIKAFIEAIEPFFEDIRAKTVSFGFNFSPKFSDDYWIARWEQALGLHPADSDSVEDRRTRVIITLNEKKPITEVRLHRLLAAICGKDGYHFEIHNLVGRFELYNVSKKQARQVYEMLERLLPLNIWYETFNKTKLEPTTLRLYGIGDLTKEVEIPRAVTSTTVYNIGVVGVTRMVDIRPRPRTAQAHVQTVGSITQYIDT